MFLKQLRLHFLLQLELVRVFSRHAFSDTIQATVYRALSEIAQVFALFIPLKIIIIMGSKDIPLYFQGYISDETRTSWLLFLIALTFFIYLFSIFFGMLSHRKMIRGFDRLNISQAYPGCDNKKIRQNLKRIYRIAVNGYTNLLIILAGLLISFLLESLIILATIIFLILQLILVNYLISADDGYKAKLGHSILKEPADYLNYFASINFLIVFALLAAEYLLTGQLNMMSAILTLLLSRRTFQALKQYGVIALKLSDEEDSVAYLLRSPP